MIIVRGMEMKQETGNRKQENFNLISKLVKTKKGFTLIELILVISVGITISMLSFTSMLRNQEDLQSKALGQQIKQIADASNLYITNHYDLISALQNSTGMSTDPGPRTCIPTNLSCTITIQTLMNEGLLPSSYSQKNSFGIGYHIFLKRGGTAPCYRISGVAITNSSLITGTGNSIRYDMLGKAMQEAGIDSGMTRATPTVLEGFKGSWNNTSTEYSVINKQGLLSYQLGYGTYAYSVFLRRDGTLPMTGDLNMGTKNIYGAANITASGKGSFGGEVEAGSWIHARNGYGDLISIGGDSIDSDYEINLVHLSL